METEHIAIVGGGQAGAHLVDSLRSAGFDGGITLIGDEVHLPYARTPLSKGFLTGAVAESGVPLFAGSWYRDVDVDLLIGSRVSEIDLDSQKLWLEEGSAVGFSRLVLATGARPRALRLPGARLEGVVPLHTLESARELRDRLAAARNVVVIGASLVGLEVAATARAAGASVVVLEASVLMTGGALSPRTAEWLRRAHLRAGERVLVDTLASEILGERDEVVAVKDRWGQTHIADVVVLTAGSEPNSELAVASGLAVSQGIMVDEYLTTSHPAVSAIGDCASLVDPIDGSRIRLPSAHNATDQARYLAQRLMGGHEPYRSLPTRSSNQHTVMLETIGRTDIADEFVVRGEPESGRFGVLCFRQDALVGVESVNDALDCYHI